MELEEPMNRKLSVTIILVLLASLFVTMPVSAAKSYYAERFDVQIDLQEDGAAIITETVEFRFSGDPFTFAFREIFAAETDGVAFLDASMDGVPMPLGTGAGQVEVEAGKRLKVTWHFPPTSDAARVFTVRYRAEGVIRKGDADTLIWRAVPEDHDYSISKSTIILTYPPKATLLEQPTLDWNHDSRWEGDRLILTASGLGPDEELILTARFSPDSLTQSTPQWQTRQEQSKAATGRALPFGFGAGIVTLILGGLGLFTYARANSRELSVSPVVSTPNPPSDMSPAVVGKLTGQQLNFMGAIFDLAQRGALEVREEKGFWGTKNHVLVRTDRAVALQSFEAGLMEALFKSDETQVNMSEVATRLASKNKLFDQPLEQELIQRGWLDKERKQKKGWLTAAGILMMFFSIVIGFVGLMGGGVSVSSNPDWLILFAALVGFAVGLFLLSIPVLIYAGLFSILTPAGEEQLARWKGFAEYLKQASKGKEPAIRPDYFEKYLAYAAVFGLGTNWAKYFQKLGGVPLPIWFHAAAGSDGDFGAMVAVMSASDTAGGGADGGAGGASGGGSSGAG
jgi:uncharacterized protein (TIGR04222 family)